MKMENLNHMENNQLPLQPYPEELFDEHGYPTEEALNYIDMFISRQPGHAKLGTVESLGV